EPGAADAEHGPAAGQVVERRRQLGGVAGVAERVRPDHQPHTDARRVRGEAGEDAPALEDRLLPRPEDGHQVIPRPDRVPARLLGGEGRIAEARPVGLLRPELEPEARHSSARWSWMAIGAMRKLIRSWRSNDSAIVRSTSSGLSPG